MSEWPQELRAELTRLLGPGKLPDVTKKEIASPLATIVGELVDEVFRLRGRILSASREINDDRGLCSHAQGVVLSAVVHAVEPPTVARIARSLGLTRQSVQRTANDMEAMGLLRFEDNPNHKTARQLVATEAGLAVHARGAGSKVLWTESVGQVVGERELRQAVKVLHRIRTHLEQPGTGQAAFEPMADR